MLRLAETRPNGPDIGLHAQRGETFSSGCSPDTHRSAELRFGSLEISPRGKRRSQRIVHVEHRRGGEGEGVGNVVLVVDA